ncbi:MucR family transcriptional regulator [Sphingomonas oligophenolica]|uniref:Transcriptional regulator n=1 Tax=Sphingomonas oligophenolica TaxID=301154 RepID=A0A502CK58_9SPHN|nr:MucR family transcriptional regulator [Sphingomonas oligophenolica]TPG13193.1 transcriptional regulator [Sphingomonas oligophenolica]
MENDISTTELATALTVAWLSNPNTRTGADDVPTFMQTAKAALDNMVTGTTSAAGATDSAKPEPAVGVRKSLASDDHLLSMIDGKPYKTLRRHLSTQGYTPDSYRETFGLKSDYPMVAKTYSERRSVLAKKIGLGRNPRQKPTTKA